MARSGASRDKGPAFLTVIVDNTEVQRRPFAGPITLGRSLDCDLWLEDPILSRRHCLIEPALEGDGWVVIDLESRNGTFVNGVRVMQRHPLNHRDVITIGRAHLKFHAYGYTPPRPADPGAALLMPARTKAAMDGRALTRQQPNRPLPTPKVASNDSTLSSSPGDTISSDRSIAFTRPPARPIIKPQDEDER